MVILVTDIQSDHVSQDDALRVLTYARTIAPTLDALEGDGRLAALAILRGVAAEVVTRGSRMVESQTIGPARVKYTSVSSAFTADDRAALRALCAQPFAGMPAGSFPRGSAVGNVWPEVYT